MAALILSTVWTVVSVVLFVKTQASLADWERAFFILFPIVGLFFMAASLRDLRRRRSLRVEECEGVSIYVWVDLDGRECRSDRDPREDWDSDDGDDGGDGDGGGGGD